MGGVYVYCLGPGEWRSPPALRGVDGAPVLLAEAAGFRAWISLFEATPRPTERRIRQHHDVVRRACALPPTPLPARFGQWFPTGEALEGALQPRAGALRGTLEAIRDAVECGVRIALPPDTEDAIARDAVEGSSGERGSRNASAGADGERVAPSRTGEGIAPPGTGDGRAYMEALLRHERRRRAARERGRRVAGELREHLGSLVRDERAEPARPPALVCLAHLVAREKLGRYREAVLEFATERPGLRVRAVGPLPPYSFAA